MLTSRWTQCDQSIAMRTYYYDVQPISLDSEFEMVVIVVPRYGPKKKSSVSKGSGRLAKKGKCIFLKYAKLRFLDRHKLTTANLNSVSDQFLHGILEDYHGSKQQGWGYIKESN